MQVREATADTERHKAVAAAASEQAERLTVHVQQLQRQGATPLARTRCTSSAKRSSAAALQSAKPGLPSIAVQPPRRVQHSGLLQLCAQEGTKPATEQASDQFCYAAMQQQQQRPGDQPSSLAPATARPPTADDLFVTSHAAERASAPAGRQPEQELAVQRTQPVAQEVAHAGVNTPENRQPEHGSDAKPYDTQLPGAGVGHMSSAALRPSDANAVSDLRQHIQTLSKRISVAAQSSHRRSIMTAHNDCATTYRK